MIRICMYIYIYICIHIYVYISIESTVFQVKQLQTGVFQPVTGEFGQKYNLKKAGSESLGIPKLTEHFRLVNYPLVSSNMAMENPLLMEVFMGKSRFIARKITYFCGPFSSLPCLMKPEGRTNSAKMSWGSWIAYPTREGCPLDLYKASDALITKDEDNVYNMAIYLICIYTYTPTLYIIVYIYIYVYIHVCMYIYIYIYIYTHTHKILYI